MSLSLLPLLPGLMGLVTTTEVVTAHRFPGFTQSTQPLPSAGLMDWSETKPFHSETERVLFTFGNNLKPQEKIMCHKVERKP